MAATPIFAGLAGSELASVRPPSLARSLSISPELVYLNPADGQCDKLLSAKTQELDHLGEHLHLQFSVADQYHLIVPAMRTRSLANYCIVLFAESSGIARGLVSRKIPGNLCRASTKPETDELQHRHFRAAVDAEIKKNKRATKIAIGTSAHSLIGGAIWVLPSKPPV